MVMTGYHALSSGAVVDFDWRTPGQDGFDFTALVVWVGRRSNDADDSIHVDSSGGDSGAYNSQVTINPS